MVGIKQLAAHLNISIGTVSRALNNKPDVNSETRQRVLNAATELEYSPNHSGRSLRKGKTGVVAAILPTSEAKPFGNTIFAALANAMRYELSKNSVDLIVLLNAPEETPLSFLKRTVRRGLADGIIISEMKSQGGRIDYLLKQEFPFVAFGRSGNRCDFPWVDLDVEDMAASAADRFLQLGTNRIALVSPIEPINFERLFRTVFQSRLQEGGVSLEESSVIKFSDGPMASFKLCCRLLDMNPRPLAVAITDINLASEICRHLTDAGLKIGSDIVIVSGLARPDFPIHHPGINYFDTDLNGLGSRLTTMLLSQLSTDSTAVYSELGGIRWPVSVVESSDGQATTLSSLHG